MKEYPIIFSGPMVRAIREGRKTQTRRVIKMQPSIEQRQRILSIDGAWCIVRAHPSKHIITDIRCPYGQPGDLLWVRETWFNPDYQVYGVTNEPTYYRATDDPDEWPWRSSIHMPRWASRLTLRITDVRVQRVQEISRQDAAQEGIADDRPGVDTILAFHRVWDFINAKRGYGWETNPWIWVISFEKLSQPQAVGHDCGDPRPVTGNNERHV